MSTVLTEPLLCWQTDKITKFFSMLLLSLWSLIYSSPPIEIDYTIKLKKHNRNKFVSVCDVGQLNAIRKV